MSATSPIDELTARELLLEVEVARTERMRAEGRMLRLGVQWCQLHGNIAHDSEHRTVPGSETLVALGGDGTPEVEEFAAVEFGAMAHLHPMAARNLMADGLDLTHRLPRTWRAATEELRLEVWVARKIATLTRTLDRRAALAVDAAIEPCLESLTPGRLFALVEAKVIEADPQRAEEARRQAEQARFVRTTRDPHGISTLIARATTGDVIVLEAMVARIAEILAENGDEEPVDVRRARAIGILAHPARALRLLLGAGHGQGVDDQELDAVHDPDGHLRTLLDQIDQIDQIDQVDHRALRALRPPVKLFVHLSQDALDSTRGRVARIEGHGPMLADQVRDWLGQSDAHIEVTGVLDLADQRPVDGYEFPSRIIEAAHQLTPVEPFPWSTNTSRRRDTDHPDPYREGGPPGQTGLHNCARLTRHLHRLKTHAPWRLIQPAPGIYLWRSPHGFWFRIDHTGTHRAGDDNHIQLADPAA